jgi:hypothetical protein
VQHSNAEWACRASRDPLIDIGLRRAETSGTGMKSSLPAVSVILLRAILAPSPTEDYMRSRRAASHQAFRRV